jgi:tyrosine-protein phosphatase YwqE
MGWFSSLRSRPVAELFEGFTDWHCHILPGVDDGFRTMEDSLEVLSRYEQAGVKEVWLTPHIMEDIPNTTDGLRARFAQLKEAYQGPLALHLASENMLDSLFQERLEAGDLLPYEEGRLLVETSYYSAPLRFREMLREIRQAGWEPVLAHPERYRYMRQEEYKSLYEEEVIFQLNIPSLLGFYGTSARGRAEWLLENGMYSLCATDVHQLAGYEKLIAGRMPAKIHERVKLLL